MDLQVTKQLNIDFSTQKYISLNMKQYDRNSRFILVTCYNQGELIRINNDTCFAYVRYRKSDNNGVFNVCTVTNDGKVLIEITEQMLSVSGMAYVDLVIHEAINTAVEITETSEDGTAQIVETGDNSILSTMTFCINVQEASFDNEDIESSYEYNALNEILIEARRNYDEIVNACYNYRNETQTSADSASNSAIVAQSYAVGGTGTRENEDSSNAEYYWTMTKAAQKDALTFRSEAQTSADSANSSAITAQSYTVGGTGTREGEDTDNASYYYEWSKKVNTDAQNFAKKAQSYAVGDTNLRENESVDNASYYYNQLKDVVDGLDSVFIPMGTITFAELATAEKDTGYLYNISNDFTTNSTFKCGTGINFSAGTNVFYTADGYWSCLSGADSPSVLTTDVATLAEVTEYLNI